MKTVLVLAPKEDFLVIHDMLNSEDYRIMGMSDLSVIKVLVPYASAIICQAYGCGTDWKTVLQDLYKTKHAVPPIIVYDQKVDENLWAEVLNLGGYDVLVKPFNSEEVRRVVRSATENTRTIRVGR